MQFHPYVQPMTYEWELVWGRSPREMLRLPEPRTGRPAFVFLESEDAAARLGSDPRSFPAARFPATVTATDALKGVFLDREPEWDGARRRAFLDWLRRGGRLHLLRSGGSEIRFAGELAPLNSPLQRFRLGAGVVERHDFARGELDANRLRELGIGTRAAPEDGSPWSSENHFLQALQSVGRAKHNWTLIHWCAAAFLILMGPVHWFLSRRRLDYRRSILFLVAGIALFSVLFFQLGKSGYSQQASVHTLALARPVAAGEYDVTQYCSVFVTGATPTRSRTPRSTTCTRLPRCSSASTA